MIGHTLTLDIPFDDAIETVTKALADQGFGIITRIDMHTTFAQKLGVDFPPYVILGACNPGLAHKAVSEKPEIGLLLPCNITVEQVAGGTRIRLPDAARMLGEAGMGESAALDELASDAGARLDQVAAALAG